MKLLILASKEVYKKSRLYSTLNFERYKNLRSIYLFNPKEIVLYFSKKLHPALHSRETLFKNYKCKVFSLDFFPCWSLACIGIANVSQCDP